MKYYKFIYFLAFVLGMSTWAQAQSTPCTGNTYSTNADFFRKITIPALLGTVMAYQVVGTLIEWVLVGDFYLAAQDFRIGIPGMLLQIFGGYALLKAIAKR